MIPVCESILVLCQANVCRSVYAGSLLKAGLPRKWASVRTAGIDAAVGAPPCSWVQQRCKRSAGLETPTAAGQQVGPDDLEKADLIIVMTRHQEGQVARLSLGARSKTFTLSAVVALAQAAAARGASVGSVSEWASTLNTLRGTVRTPLVPVSARGLGIFRRKSTSALSWDILDGHSGGDAAHKHTLDLVADKCGQLVAAWDVTGGIVKTCE